jgi:hypothetical protein
LDDVFIAAVRGEVGDGTIEGGARVAERGERVGFVETRLMNPRLEFLSQKS